MARLLFKHMLLFSICLYYILKWRTWLHYQFARISHRNHKFLNHFNFQFVFNKITTLQLLARSKIQEIDSIDWKQANYTGQRQFVIELCKKKQDDCTLYSQQNYIHIKCIKAHIKQEKKGDLDSSCIILRNEPGNYSEEVANFNRSAVQQIISGLIFSSSQKQITNQLNWQYSARLSRSYRNQKDSKIYKPDKLNNVEQLKYHKLIFSKCKKSNRNQRNNSFKSLQTQLYYFNHFSSRFKFEKQSFRTCRSSFNIFTCVCGQQNFFTFVILNNLLNSQKFLSRKQFLGQITLRISSQKLKRSFIRGVKVKWKPALVRNRKTYSCSTSWRCTYSRKLNFFIIFISEMPRLNSNDNLFTSKLEEILEDEETQPVISWGQNKFTIEINDKTKLLQTVLPKYFRHNRFQSFVRQMNLYGFKKIRSSKKHCFINLELKNGKKLTELKSKNQIKRQINQNHISQQQQSDHSNSNHPQIPASEAILKQNFLNRQYSQNAIALENLRNSYEQVAFQRPLTFYYNQPTIQPIIPVNPFKYYPTYPYTFFNYQ